jgi:hypothetical protein
VVVRPDGVVLTEAGPDGVLAPWPVGLLTRQREGRGGNGMDDGGRSRQPRIARAREAAASWASNRARASSRARSAADFPMDPGYPT